MDKTEADNKKCKKAEELVEAKLREKDAYDPVFDPIKSKPFCKTTGFIVTLLIFVGSTTGTVLLWGTDCWNTTILKVLTFEKNGTIFNMWRKPDIENVIKIFPFNYTNIERIGVEKPHVEELGPYIFRERIEKVNVIFNTNGTLTYSENRTHLFDDVNSGGSLSDVLFTPNIPFLSAAAVGSKRNILSQLALAALLRGLDTRPFVPIDVEGFVMGFDDSFSLVARKLSSVLKGNEPPKFGLLSSRLGLGRERVTLGSGIPDLDSLGVVSAYDGHSKLDYYTSDECNTISGSDGSIFPGNVVRKSSKLHIYVNNFCRRIPIQFYGEKSIFENIPSKRYELPHDLFDTPEEKPENSCYCAQGTQCSPKGTFRTSICNFDAPVLVSFPHFLHGDPELGQNVTGLSPDVSRHRFFMDIHESLGIPVGGQTRFQANVIVKHCPFLSQLNSIPEGTILPIAWVEIELGRPSGTLKELLYHATYTAAYVYQALSWTCLLLMALSLVRIFSYLLYKR